ncbi:MAG: transglycosylase SLT domain-containing protein [Halioglobus sp.]|nr:transglycosylase SLT domain-containing protein [Halioglobus sp.]
MRPWDTGRLTRMFRLVAVAVLALAISDARADSLAQQRQDYGAALVAVGLGDTEAYAQWRERLVRYPLAIYLDYYQLRRNMGAVSVAEAVEFVQRSAQTPLANRFLSAYLREAGKNGRWRDYLAVMPDTPNSVDLQCYFFRAQLAQGQSAQAWNGARRLWVHGESQPSACDPLFAAWMAAGQLTDDIVWTRLLNAFDARQRALMDYVAKKSSADLRPWADKLLAVYRDPDSLRRQSLPPAQPRSRDIASHGLAYLARYSPSQALSLWNDLRPRMDFTEVQVRRVEYAIALHALFARTAPQEVWLRGALSRLQDDKLTGIRLRWALAEADWAALEYYLPLLTEAGQAETGWRYWKARLAVRQGDSVHATAALQQIAAERDYYGFLAADRLGRDYAFNHAQPAVRDTAAVAALPAVKRIAELRFHQESALAHAEWYTLLQDTTEPQSLQALMLLASEKGWHRMAIDAATRAQAWDALSHRFPTAQRAVFARHAATQSLPTTELMAIARRESAFYPRAQSPAGARGLMQIMPATGKAVAASLRLPHSRNKLFEVEHNVTLGSVYYRQLLDRFDGNRVYALAGYNAGPHRVQRWRDKGLSVAMWIETIPFRETRNYVQAVLAYNVVFQYLLGDTPRLFTAAESQAVY